ncbi:MAG: TonB-dependent receptor [Chlorobi bacterium]|nr:TonB-dependent receptor [Chlorobiota bacterium]
MSKIKIITAIFILLISNYAFAEKEEGVTGQVKDAQTKKPIEFCSIVVFNEKDSLLTGGVTDEGGFFSIPLARGKYKFLIEYIGYVSDTVSVNVRTGSEFLGVFKLEPDNSLEEVVVNGRTESNLIDKDVYLVTKDLKTGAANTKEVLSRVKGVTYDRYNNSIKVDGEENIIILVNGLEKDQKYIKNLTPERLKKIEVIRDPSGRYALEGYSAVINVILKDDYKGYEISVEERAISDLDNEETEFLLPINNTSLNFNYTYNKVNLYAKYDYNYMDLKILSTATKKYNTGLEIIKTGFNDKPNTEVSNINDGITIGADYYLNPKHTISFESSFDDLLFNEEKNINKIQSTYILNGVVIDELNTENNNDATSSSNSHTLYYLGKFNNSNSIKADFTFSKYSKDYINHYYEDNLLQRTEIGTNDNTNTKFYVEFNHTINAKSNYQIGYGNTTKNRDNTYSIGTTTDNYEYTDFRNKFYAYYSYKFNDKLGIKIGGAAETSQPKSGDLSTTYFIYQPYADIKYKPAKFLDIRFKYRSSSDYPSISQANPFEYIIDAETVQKGNPLLEPSVKHKISVKFKILQGLATIEPYYHFSNNYISKTGFLRDDGIFEYNYSNTGEYEHKGIKGNLTVPVGKSFFWQSSANFFTSKIVYNNIENSFSDWKMNSQLIYINKKHGTVGGLIYQNNMYKFITAQGYNKWNNDFWGLFVQQDFFKRKLHVMAFYMLPIEYGLDFDQGSYVKTDSYIETNIQDMHILKNIFMLEISFRLNRGKSIRKTEKDIKKEEKSSKGGIF